MSRVCFVKGLSCPGFVVSRICRLQDLSVQGLFVCVPNFLSVSLALCKPSYTVLYEYGTYDYEHTGLGLWYLKGTIPRKSVRDNDLRC
jgi:hypothetical protein